MRYKTYNNIEYRRIYNIVQYTICANCSSRSVNTRLIYLHIVNHSSRETLTLRIRTLRNETH